MVEHQPRLLRSRVRFPAGAFAIFSASLPISLPPFPFLFLSLPLPFPLTFRLRFKCTIIPNRLSMRVMLNEDIAASELP